VCVNSASTVLRGAGNNDGDKARQQSRSSRVRQGVIEALFVMFCFHRRSRSTRLKSTIIYLHLLPARITQFKSPLDHLFEDKGDCDEKQ